MLIPAKSSGLLWIFLAVMVAFTPGPAILAGDVPRKGAVGRLSAPALAGLIDKAIRERLSAEKAVAKPGCSSVTMLVRRVSVAASQSWNALARPKAARDFPSGE